MSVFHELVLSARHGPLFPNPVRKLSMAIKSLPFNESFIRDLCKQFPTPFYLYDESAIRSGARRLQKAFQWCPTFRNHFAVKATPNPYLIEILHEEGFGTDCSSMAELLISQAAGITGNQIMFTSNNTPISEYQKANQLGAIINLDDITHIDFLKRHAALPELICFRYNPGPLRQETGNAIIGNPEQAKYGFTRDQLFEGYRHLQKEGVRRFGLHTMVVSNELTNQCFVDTARMLFELSVELAEQLGIHLELVNLGGGIGIPYKPDQKEVDIEAVSHGIQKIYDAMIAKAGLDPLTILMENGRAITGPYGYLITTALHEKNTYKKYVGVDACMSNLMRPGMYGAYHHITVLGKEDQIHDTPVDVVGSLCENNDKFAIDRNLPAVEVGDLLVIHDAGAHGHAMGFQYNGKLRSAEVLLRADRTVQEIRRAETISDYFATLDYPGLTANTT